MEHQRLEVYRGEIDSIDAEMVALFKKRMEVCARVSEYKREHNLPVLMEDRERALLAKVGALAGEDLADHAQSVYHTILAESRAYQNKLLGRQA